MATVSKDRIPAPGSNLICQTCGDIFARGKAGVVPRFCSDRCRKASYAGTCTECGKPTSGSNGRDKAPLLCLACSSSKLHDPFSAAARRRGRRISVARTRWTDADIAGALHACAIALSLPTGHGPSVKAYIPWQQSQGAAPTASRIVQRFGRWRLALEAAGLTASPGTRENHGRTYTAEMCLDAIRQCAAQVGKAPTYTEYEAFARRREPRRGARVAGAPPSGATIRNTVDRSWLACLEAALR